MHVIAGEAKGHKLETLKGLRTRPTSGKIKESIFSAIQFDLLETTVLDLYAGSGQMGIEALSRGAKLAVFVENNRGAISVIKNNLNKTNLIKKAKISTSDALQYIMITKDKIDIAIVDPPYDKMEEINKILLELSKIMTDKAIISCETLKEVSLLDDLGNGIKIYKEYNYGRTKITMYRKED